MNENITEPNSEDTEKMEQPAPQSPANPVPAPVTADPKLPQIGGVPTICILGDPGAGKTRLASIFPDPYFLDFESGAGSAVPEERRKSFLIGPDVIAEGTSEIKKLQQLPYANKRIDMNGMPIGGVVIDSLDALQQVFKYENLSHKRYGDPRQMWGELLDTLVPFVYETKKVRVPIIWVAHVKTIEPTYTTVKGGGVVLSRVGLRGIATQGSLEEQILRWFDYVLHLMIRQDEVRQIFTQPTVYEDCRLVAKDRHNLFKNMGKTNFPIGVDDNGFPKTRALQTIYERHAY